MVCNQLTAIVVDNDNITRKKMIQMLEETGYIKIIGEAVKGKEFFQVASSLKPNIVFVDIQLPDVDGLTVARKLLEKNPNLILIFTSSFPYYAFDAFEISATDYLLKPLTHNRIAKCINKIKKCASGVFKKKIRIPGFKTDVYITPDDILFVETDKRQTIIHTVKGVFNSKEKIARIESNLSEPYFIRAHRSFLINLKRVNAVETTGDRTYEVSFEDYSHRASLSRTKKKEFDLLISSLTYS